MGLEDTWEQHLAKYQLAELDTLAEEATYRIRTANDWQFGIEPTGRLTLHLPHVKEFENTDAGKLEAIAFLASVKGLLVRVEEESISPAHFLLECKLLIQQREKKSE